MDYVRGGQVVLDWATIEPSRGVFNFSSATSQIANYVNGGKPLVLQINSSTKPSWIYNQGSIVQVGTYTRGSTTWDIPYYWNPLYLTLMQEMLEAVAQYVRTSPYRNSILGMRATPNLIGNEPYSLNDSGVTITNTSVANTWTDAIGTQVYENVMRLYNQVLLPDIQPILRSVLFANYNTDPALRTELLGVNKGWAFGTNANPDSNLPIIDNFFYDQVRSGITRGFYESQSTSSSHALSWSYWRQLLDLSRGVYYIATYSDELVSALPGQPEQPEYRAIFDTTNFYAGYQATPATTPGAFIAFRSGTKSTDINYMNFMSLHDSNGTIGGENATVALDSNGGVSIIGPASQRFGRFARRTDIASGKATFYLRADATFKSSLSGTVTVRVTYLDVGTNQWTLSWQGGSLSTTKQNSGQWKQKSISVPASGLSGSLAASSDLLLSSSGSDTTFHMVEILR